MFTLASSARGQKTEYRINFNSGLYAFHGLSARSTTLMDGSYASTMNPQGSRPGLSYGFSGDVKRVGKRSFLIGVDLGFEQLRSRIAVNFVSVTGIASSENYRAKGETIFRQQFLNLYPYAGYRFQLRALQLDLSAGLDLAKCLGASEKGKATAENGWVFETRNNKDAIQLDVRPRVQIAANYNRLTLYGGYATGLKNYRDGWYGGRNELYSGYLRFGASYLIH